MQKIGAGPGAVAQTCMECNFWWLGSPVSSWVLESDTFILYNLSPMRLVTILILCRIPLTLHYLLSTIHYITVEYLVSIIQHSILAVCYRYFVAIQTPAQYTGAVTVQKAMYIYGAYPGTVPWQMVQKYKGGFRTWPCVYMYDIIHLPCGAAPPPCLGLLSC